MSVAHNLADMNSKPRLIRVQFWKRTG